MEKRQKIKKPEFLQGSSGCAGIDAVLMRQPHKQGSSGKGCAISGQDFPDRKAHSAECNMCSQGGRQSTVLLWLHSESYTRGQTPQPGEVPKAALTKLPDGVGTWQPIRGPSWCHHPLGPQQAGGASDQPFAVQGVIKTP